MKVGPDVQKKKPRRNGPTFKTAFTFLFVFHRSFLCTLLFWIGGNGKEMLAVECNEEPYGGTHHKSLFKQEWVPPNVSSFKDLVFGNQPTFGRKENRLLVGWSLRRQGSPRPWMRRQVPNIQSCLVFGNLSTALGYNLGRSSSSLLQKVGPGG